MSNIFIDRTLTDPGFPSDRDGVCTVCSELYRQGEAIATAPSRFWERLDEHRWGRRVGHRRCVIRARIEDHERAERAS